MLGGVQFWYAAPRGNTLVHHYRVGDESGVYTFELSLETENLTWKLDKVTETRSMNFGFNQLAGAAS